MESATIQSTQPAVGVSVVIPAYNYAGYLSVAIRSALQQTCKPAEIIVVDDGSTDDTAAVVAAFGNRVRYIHQANAGLSAARNTGIALAVSPFVALLDADDAWQPEHLELAMKTFERLGSEYAVVACAFSAINSQGAPLADVPDVFHVAGEVTVRDLVLRSRFSPSSAVVRRSAFAECGGFDTGLRSSEDRDMWIRIASRYRLWRNEAKHLLVRKHGSNMSGHADRMKVNMATTLKKTWMMRLVPRWALLFWLQVLGVYFYQTSLMYEGAQRWQAALRDILWALAACPFPIAQRKIGSLVHAVRLRALARILKGALARLFAHFLPTLVS